MTGEWIANRVCDRSKGRNVMITHREYFLDGMSTPRVWQVEMNTGRSLDAVTDWLARYRDDFNQQLTAYGGVLLRGIESLRTPDDMQHVLDVLAPDLMDYVGGTSPRKVVSGRIMTATEVPGNYSIPLHQEMSYTDNAPEGIAFFCEVPPGSDGETTIGDMREITSLIDPAVRDRFDKRGGVQLRRNLPSPENVSKRPGVPKAWTEVFRTEDRKEAEAVVIKSGWRSEWLDDGSMQLWQEVRPATRRHPRTNDEVWFNQVHIFAPAASLKWARNDGRTEMAGRLEKALAEAPHLLDQIFYGDGTPVTEDDVLHIYDTLDVAAKPLKWQRGDLLILDNILAAHGRRAFQGDRRILTALIRHSPAISNGVPS
jgi:hypothetical protein